MLRFLKHKDIDFTRWNTAVTNDLSCLPYGFTWWLDAVCPNRWDGIVFDDYRAVMPLPREPFSLRRPISSWARPQVQRPFFTQQGGPFGDVRIGDITRLFAALPAEFSAFQLPLSENTAADEVPPDFTTEWRTNLVLNLSPDLEAIRAGYHKDLRRKLRRYSPAALIEADPELIITTYQENLAAKIGLKTKHFTCARALINAALKHNAGYCYQLQSPDGELLATGFFPHHRGRVINLLGASTPLGYQDAGMARLIDAMIKQHRGPGCQFDFEGSDVPGIARFFSSFGPEERPYLSIA